MAIPGSVLAAIGVVASLLVVNLWASAQVGELPLAQIAVQSLVLVGLAARHRLAWQWGRLLPALAIPFLLLWALLSPQGAPALLLLAPLVLVPLALGRPSARAWFGVVCASCGSTRVRAVDLLFRRARCRACGREWGGAA